MTRDTSHLQALITRLGNEKKYLAAAKSKGEIDLRKVWISQIEKEIAAEEKFLDMPAGDEFTGSDDELLAELGL